MLPRLLKCLPHLLNLSYHAKAPIIRYYSLLTLFLYNIGHLLRLTTRLHDTAVLHGAAVAGALGVTFVF